MKVIITFRMPSGGIGVWNTTEGDLENTLAKFETKNIDVIDWEYV